jgi:hypothetical protein
MIARLCAARAVAPYAHADEAAEAQMETGMFGFYCSNWNQGVGDWMTK